MREITLMRMNDVVVILETDQATYETYRDAERTEADTWLPRMADKLVGHWQREGFNLYTDRTF